MPSDETKMANVCIALMAMVASLAAQQVPLRIATDEAMRSVQKIVNPSPITSIPGNAVTADVIIGMDGSVEAVTVLDGQSAHVKPAVDAIKQWKFRPIARDGKPVRAIAKVAVYVPDKPPSAEPELTAQASQALHECSDLVNSRDFAQAELVCSRAVEAADKLGPWAVLERSGAHAWLGHALLFQSRGREALTHYTTELKLVEGFLKPTEAEVASAHRHVAMAHVLLGDLAVADRELGRAAEIMEAAIVSLPSERARYVEDLRTILRDRAQVKRRLGDEAAAVSLEKQAQNVGLNQ